MNVSSRFILKVSRRHCKYYVDRKYSKSLRIYAKGNNHGPSSIESAHRQEVSDRRQPRHLVSNQQSIVSDWPGE